MEKKSIVAAVIAIAFCIDGTAQTAVRKPSVIQFLLRSFRMEIQMVV